MTNFDLDNVGSGFQLDDDGLDDLLDEANARGEIVGEDNTFEYFAGVDTREVPDSGTTAQHSTHQEDIRESSEDSQSYVESSRTEVEPVFVAPVETPQEDEEDSDDDVLSEPSFDSVSDEELIPETEEETDEFEEDTYVPIDPFAVPTPPTYENDVHNGSEEFVVDDRINSNEELSTPVENFTEVRETVETPAPVVVEETPVHSSSSYAAPKMRVPSLADDLHRVRQVVNILDAYRGLSSEEKSVAGQFVTAGGDVESESDFIVKVINADPMLSKTMKLLTEAKALDDVERSFFIIELDNDVLYSLGSLVSVFVEIEDDNSARNRYARNLVRSIEQLDSKAMGFVSATEKVLSAAEVSD